jgi:hypothetical protein
VDHDVDVIGVVEPQLFRGSSLGSTSSRPSGPIADTWEMYSPDLAQWK